MSTSQDQGRLPASDAPKDSATNPRDVLIRLMGGLNALWQNTNFRPFISTQPRDTHVKTHADVGAQLLAVTGKPIRGFHGVETRRFDAEPSETAKSSDLVYQSFDLPRPWQPQDEESVRQAKLQIRDSLVAIWRWVDSRPSIRARAFESYGYKHYEPGELPTVTFDEIHFQVFFSQLIGFCLTESGLEVSQRAAFDGWNAAAERVLFELESLERRQYNRYQIAALLNGPLVDSVERAVIGSTAMSTRKGAPISIGFADDETLSKAPHDLPLWNINTALSYDVDVPVDSPVRDYLAVYSDGTMEFEAAVDVLRVVVQDDLGIEALVVTPVERFTPDIRTSLSKTYDHQLARETPRRFTFGQPLPAPIGTSELAEFRQLLAAYVSEPGLRRRLGPAFRRLRICYERYEPEDPERLLDIGMALEALYLAAEKGSELKYRLQTRGAWLLGAEPSDRAAYYNTIGRIYDARSIVAHGGELKGNKWEKLWNSGELLQSSLEVLRMTLKRMLTGHGPGTDDANQWWTNRVLGG